MSYRIIFYVHSLPGTYKCDARKVQLILLQNVIIILLVKNDSIDYFPMLILP